MNTLITFFLYQLEKNDHDCEIKYIIPVKLIDWIAKKNRIKSYSYKRIKYKTEKAILLDGLNEKGNELWIPKSQLKFKDKIRFDDEMYFGHRAYIREKENKLVI